MTKFGIGFTGAHRTGKTRLCAEISEELGITFVQTSVGDVFSKLGYNPSQEYPLATRLQIQTAILNASVMKWKEYCIRGEKFLTDRTPIDFIAYTLASVRQDELTPELDFQLQCYFDLCVKAAHDMFSHFFEVLPGIPVVHEVGKASISPSHIDHISKLISGVLAQSTGIAYYTIPKGIVGLDDRRIFCIRKMKE